MFKQAQKYTTSSYGGYNNYSQFGSHDYGNQFIKYGMAPQGSNQVSEGCTVEIDFSNFDQQLQCINEHCPCKISTKKKYQYGNVSKQEIYENYLAEKQLLKNKDNEQKQDIFGNFTYKVEKKEDNKEKFEISFSKIEKKLVEQTQKLKTLAEDLDHL